MGRPARTRARGDPPPHHSLNLPLSRSLFLTCTRPPSSPAALAYMAGTGGPGSPGFTVRGGHEVPAPPCDPLFEGPGGCPCGEAPLAWAPDEDGGPQGGAHACREAAMARHALFSLRAGLEVGGGGANASLTLAPWSAGAGGTALSGSLSATAGVTGLTPTTNRRPRPAAVWCTPTGASLSSPGFFVPPLVLLPFREAMTAYFGPPPSSNALGMNASLWGACYAARGCAATPGGPTPAYAPGNCTAVGVADVASPSALAVGAPRDQWAAYRASTPPAVTALAGGNCTHLGTEVDPGTGQYVLSLGCRYPPAGAQRLSVDVSVDASLAALEAGETGAGVVGGGRRPWRGAGRRGRGAGPCASSWSTTAPRRAGSGWWWTGRAARMDRGVCPGRGRRARTPRRRRWPWLSRRPRPWHRAWRAPLTSSSVARRRGTAVRARSG